MKVHYDNCSKCGRPYDVSLYDFHLETFTNEEQYKKAKQDRLNNFMKVVQSGRCFLCYVETIKVISKQ